jgi:hypothetical protein
VLGAVLNSRFAAVSLPVALAAASSVDEKKRVTDSFSAGLEVSQLVGAVAVLLGGLVAALLLRRAQRADSEMVVA